MSVGVKRVVRVNRNNQVYVRGFHGEVYVDSEKDRSKRWAIHGRVRIRAMPSRKYPGIIKVWCMFEKRYLNMGYRHDKPVEPLQ